jgi:hypothetical protein
LQRQKDEAEAAALSAEYNTLKSKIPDFDLQIQTQMQAMQAPAPQMQAPAANTNDAIAAGLAMLLGGATQGQAFGKLGQQARERSQTDFQNQTNQFNVDRQNAGMRMDYLQGMRQETMREADKVRSRADGIYDFWQKMDLQKEQQGIARTERLEDEDRDVFNKLTQNLRLANTVEDAEAIFGMLTDIASRVPGLSIPAGLKDSAIGAARKREEAAARKETLNDVKEFNRSLNNSLSRMGELSDDEYATLVAQSDELTQRGGSPAPVPRPGRQTVAAQNAQTGRMSAAQRIQESKARVQKLQTELKFLPAEKAANLRKIESQIQKALASGDEPTALQLLKERRIAVNTEINSVERNIKEIRKRIEDETDEATIKAANSEIGNLNARLRILRKNQVETTDAVIGGTGSAQAGTPFR